MVDVILVFTKVVQIIKCICTVFIDNFRNISNNSSIQVSVCRGSYGGYVKHKKIIQCSALGIPKGMKKMQFLFLLRFALTFYQK